MRSLKRPVIIAVASGKGGTGKTFVSLGLALSYGGKVQLLDADVEEPNDHLFIEGPTLRSEPVHIPVAKVDASTCRGCGRCVEACHFNAIAMVRGEAMVFDELCHSCGVCYRVCPEGCIEKIEKRIGSIEARQLGNLTLTSGILDVGHASCPPLIRRLKREIDPKVDVVVIDGPPGTSCAMVAAVEGADHTLLVAEPTPFGLHDLDLSVQVLSRLGMPFSIVLNKDEPEQKCIDEYCQGKSISIDLRIPKDSELATLHGKGKIWIEARPAMKEALGRLVERLRLVAKVVD